MGKEITLTLPEGVMEGLIGLSLIGGAVVADPTLLQAGLYTNMDLNAAVGVLMRDVYRQSGKKWGEDGVTFKAVARRAGEVIGATDVISAALDALPKVEVSPDAAPVDVSLN